MPHRGALWARLFSGERVGNLNTRPDQDREEQLLATLAQKRLRRIIIEYNQETRMPEFKLQIDGMHCGACIRRVSQALASAEGVQVQAVRLGEARLSTNLVPPPIDLAIAALARAGYSARLEP